MAARRMPAAFSVGAIAMISFWPSICLAQPHEIRLRPDPYGGLQPPRPTTPTPEIQKALRVVIETKDFHDKLPLLAFLNELGGTISKKGKEIQVRIDLDAFPRTEDKLYVHEEAVCLPKVPSKLVSHTALRLVLSQVGQGEATHFFRSGQVLITSHARAKSPYFVDSTYVDKTFKDRALVDALDELAEQSGVSIIVDARVANKAQTKVTAKLSAKLLTAVRLLTDTADLRSVVVDNVIYVTSPENARVLKKTSELQLSEGSPGGRVEISNRAPLSKAIESAWGNYVIDGRIKDKLNNRVTAKWLNHVEPDTKLRILTDMAGLKHVAVDGVAYITSPENARRVEEEKRKKSDK